MPTCGTTSSNMAMRSRCSWIRTTRWQIIGVFEVPVRIFFDEKGMVQKYIKGELLPGQVILDVVARPRKQEPMKAASLH